MPIQFPILTPRLTIRPMQVGDAAALLAAYGDSEILQHLGSGCPRTITAAEQWCRSTVERHQKDEQLSLWTAVDTESGQIVGDVGLQRHDDGPGVGEWPRIGVAGHGSRAFWRQGLGFEAAAAAIRAGFAELDLPGIGATPAPDDLPAQSLLHRLGMTEVGRNPGGRPVYLITQPQWRRTWGQPR